MGYAAFISYSHAADGRLAPALQSALHRFAKPWWKLRALDVFRDETSLAAAHDLSGAIKAALEGARFFILLASPGAAQSKWVAREVELWRATKPVEAILIVKTEGTIAWDDAAHDFGWGKTDSVPRALAGAFGAEPLWIDLAWARTSEHLSMREPRFQQAVAMLAARLHGKSLDQIAGEEVRQHRRTRRLTRAAMASIALLAVAASAGAYFAYRGEQRAERNLVSALTAADTLVEEIAEKFRDSHGISIELTRTILARAEGIYAQLDPSDSSDAVQFRRARMLKIFTETNLLLGDTAAARRRSDEMLRTTLALASKKRANLDWQRALMWGYVSRAQVLEAQGDLPGALAAARAGLAIAVALARRNPTEARWQSELATAHEAVGDVRLAQSGPAGATDALVEYRASHSIREGLVRREIGNGLDERALAISHCKLGDAFSDLRNWDKALEAYRACLALIERLARAEPRNARWQRDLSVGHRRVGVALGQRGDLAGAIAAYRRSLSTIQPLTLQDPGNASWQFELSVSHEKIGDARFAQGGLAGPPDALAEYRASLALRESLAHRDPRNGIWLRGIAVIHGRIALVLAKQGDAVGAVARIRTGFEIAERLVTLDPSNREWADDLAWFRARRAALEAGATDSKSARD